jgi:hypothetical protein
MTSSVDEQVTFFNHTILNLFEQSVPLRRGVRRPNVNPWFNIYIERAIIDRNLAHLANARRATAQRSTGTFVPPARSFAFSNVNSRDVFIAKVPDPLEPGHFRP